MKKKLFAVGVLVVVCLSVLVVEGVSQPPSRPPAIAPVRGPAQSSNSQANFSTVAPQQQAQTFEQLADALQAVRARQKELKTQESDLLAKMAEKIEEKRKDLQKAEETLQQLQREPNRHEVIIDKDKSK